MLFDVTDPMEAGYRRDALGQNAVVSEPTGQTHWQLHTSVWSQVDEGSQT
jgi:hypothetical protein